MPTYKLTYFDVRGRGELCRYVFHAASRDFEDERIERDSWPGLKPTTPYGQLPLLDVDGKKLGQSDAIARYLAKEFDLAGKTNWDQGLIDQYMGVLGDMFAEMVTVFKEKDDDKKKEMHTNLAEVVFPKFLGIFEKSLDKNGGKYLVGDSLTLADLALYNGFDTAVMGKPDILDSFDKIKAHREMVEERPNLAEYVKNRKPSHI